MFNLQKTDSPCLLNVSHRHHFSWNFHWENTKAFWLVNNKDILVFFMITCSTGKRWDFKRVFPLLWTILLWKPEKHYIRQLLKLFYPTKPFFKPQALQLYTPIWLQSMKSQSFSGLSAWPVTPQAQTPTYSSLCMMTTYKHVWGKRNLSSACLKLGKFKVLHCCCCTLHCYTWRLIQMA